MGLMILVVILIGLSAGILSGLMGVGGGIVLIPAMVLLLELSQHTAQGISLLVIVPTAVAGVWKLNKEDLIDFTTVVYLSLGAVTGAVMSASAIQSLSSTTLKTGFGVFIIAVGMYTLRTAWKNSAKVKS